MISPEYVKTFKKYYTLLIVGSILVVLGFICLVFIRPYAFDYSQRDLPMVFAIMFLLPGGVLMLTSAILQFRDWFKSRKDAMQPVPQFGTYQESWMFQNQPTGSLGGRSLPQEPPYGGTWRSIEIKSQGGYSASQNPAEQRQPSAQFSNNGQYDPNRQPSSQFSQPVQYDAQRQPSSQFSATHMRYNDQPNMQFSDDDPVF